MNEFIKAAENSSTEEDSEDRYNKVKKEEAGTEESDPVKERYNELKEKAKKEYKEQEENRREKEDKDEAQEDEKEDGSFVTY